jgi:hypothetical protein
MSAESEEKSYKKIEEILKRISLLKEADAKFAEIELQKLIDKTASTAEYEVLLSSINDDLDYASSTAKILSNSFRDSVNELKKGKEFLNLQVSSLRKLTSISDQLQQVRKGETVFDQKKVEKLKAQQKLYISHLNTVKEQGGLKGKALEALEDEIRLANELDDTFKDILKTNEKTNKQLGAIPQVAGGIDKAFQKLGLPNLGIKDAIDETYKLGQVAARTGDDGFKPMSTLTSMIGSNLRGMVTPANLIQAGIGLMVNALIKGDKATGDLAKSMNMTYSEANKTRSELTDIAATSGDVALNTRNLQETYMAVGKALGTNSMLNEKDLKTMTKLTQQAGMTYDELMEIEKISLVNGKSLEKNTKEILGSVVAYNRKNKSALNEKEILKDVNKMSASLKLTLGGNVDKMAEAASKAKQFGLNLEQAEKISQSLLNFESSIESELSAELLTGKDLNFERARGLALNGQTADAAAEIAKQVGTSADFAKMNVIQQEAIAKAAGMERNELAQSLIDREALTKMGVKGAKSAQEAYNELKKQGLSEVEINKRIGDDKLSGMYKQQSIQERFNQSVEKLQEIFVSLSEPILAFVSPIMDMVSALTGLAGGVLPTILKIMGGIYLLSKLSAAAEFVKLGYHNLQLSAMIAKEAYEKTGLVTAGARAFMEETILGKIILQGVSLIKNLAKGALLLAQSIARAVSESVASGAATFGVGAAIGLAAGAAAAAYLSTMKDGEIDYKKGPVVSGEFGSVQLDKNDTGFFDKNGIKAGTDILGSKKSTNNNGGSSDAALMSKIDQLINEFRNSNNKPIQVAVNVDGKQVASAVGNNSKEFYDSSRKGNNKVQ